MIEKKETQDSFGRYDGSRAIDYPNNGKAIKPCPRFSHFEKGEE